MINQNLIQNLHLHNSFKTTIYSVIMLGFIQISTKETNDSTQQIFQKYFRDCFPHIYESHLNPSELEIKYKARNIVGAILLIGYVKHREYFKLTDGANQQHLKFYRFRAKGKDINCYPIVAIVPFKNPVKSDIKGQISALKIKKELLQKCTKELGYKRLKALIYLCKQWETSKRRNLTARILTLRKPHAINLMLGIKSAEFRINRLGDKMVDKMKTVDFKKLQKYKKKPQKKRVAKLLNFCKIKIVK